MPYDAMDDYPVWPPSKPQTPTEIKLGEIAYRGYERFQVFNNNCAVDSWEELEPKEKQAWVAAALDVYVNAKLQKE